MSLLLVGATGAVGQAVLRQALAEKRITRIVAPTRRPLEAGFVGNPRLLNPVIDFARLPEEAAWWKVDAVVCTLGTTIKVAGSQAAFAAVDRDLPIAFARLAREAGATRYALNSSLGASARGSFYLRTKAEAE
ncbi:MAG TPA: NAD(P)H-binding protein, partial [Azonexus sp.]|nr:NAD(P)H-binding protein [Azonexus sp.]